MELKEILAVSGYPGLYKYVAQGARGVIVEALAGGGRLNVPSNARVSALVEVGVFTGDGGDIPLAEVFTRFFEFTGGEKTVSHKEDPAKVKAVFAQVIPDYDSERVHASDMKKIVQWFNALVEAGMKQFTIPEDSHEDKQ